MLARAIATEITGSIELSWEHAKRCNTFASYKRFLAKSVSNPNGAHIADAREALETLAYQEAVANGSVRAFEAYLRQYPDGRFTSEAMNAIPEAYLKDARSSNRLSSWRRFLAYQPDHKAADEARQAISAIEKRVHDQKPELDTPVTNGDMSIKVHAASLRWSPARASRVVKVDGKSRKEYIMCPDGVATNSSALLAAWEGYQTITVTWNLESPRDGDKITVTVLGPDGSAVPIRKEDEVSSGKIQFGVLRQDASKEWTISIGSDPPFPSIVFFPRDLP
jgi:hypothetical protein